MRTFGKIEPKFWMWAKRHELSPEAKLMAVYLLTSPHSNTIGCYYLPDGYLVEDLQPPLDPSPQTVTDTVSKPFPNGFETVTQTLSELFRKGFCRRCDTTMYLWICDFINHNPPENPNVAKNMARAIQEIPREFTYWPEFIEVLKPYMKRFPKGFETVVSNFGKPFRNGMPNGMPNKEPEPDIDVPSSPRKGSGDIEEPSEEEGKGRDNYPTLEKLPRVNGKGTRTYPPAFERFFDAYPTHVNDTKASAYKAWRKAVVTWKVDEDVLVKAAAAYAEYVAKYRKDRPDARAYVQTWINAERWTADGAGFDKPLSRHDQALLDWSRGGKVGPPPEAREFGEEDR